MRRRPSRAPWLSTDKLSITIDLCGQPVLHQPGMEGVPVSAMPCSSFERSPHYPICDPNYVLALRQPAASPQARAAAPGPCRPRPCKSSRRATWQRCRSVLRRTRATGRRWEHVGLLPLLPPPPLPAAPAAACCYCLLLLTITIIFQCAWRVTTCLMPPSITCHPPLLPLRSASRRSPPSSAPAARPPSSRQRPSPSTDRRRHHAGSAPSPPPPPPLLYLAFQHSS